RTVPLAAPTAPSMRAAATPAGRPERAKVRQRSSWRAVSTLSPNIPAASMRGRIRPVLAMLVSTSIGSREIAVSALTVTPNVEDPLPTVTMATPVGKSPMARRKRVASSVATALAAWSVWSTRPSFVSPPLLREALHRALRMAIPTWCSSARAIDYVPVLLSGADTVPNSQSGGEPMATGRLEARRATTVDVTPALRVPVGVLGTGVAVPGRVVTNHELAQTLDTSDEWIVTRTGIRQRRFLEPGRTTSDLCVEAAERALRRSGLRAEDIDAIVLATITPDQPLPSTALVVKE